MFVGFPDDVQEETPSFLDFENNWLRTDGPTDRRTDPLIEMRGRIYKTSYVLMRPSLMLSPAKEK